MKELSAARFYWIEDAQSRKADTSVGGTRKRATPTTCKRACCCLRHHPSDTDSARWYANERFILRLASTLHDELAPTANRHTGLHLRLKGLRRAPSRPTRKINDVPNILYWFELSRGRPAETLKTLIPK